MKTKRHFLGSLKNGWRNSSGQSLVETALMFPILLTFLVGAADLARIAHASIAVANAAKAGAQYGAQNGFTANDSTGIIAATAAEAPNLTLTTVPSHTCICSNGNASTCLTSDCPNSHKEEILTVSTSTTVAPMIHLPLLPSSFTVKGQAIQRCLQ
jgi:Flp pilus assembly protein TadG